MLILVKYVKRYAHSNRQMPSAVRRMLCADVTVAVCKGVGHAALGARNSIAPSPPLAATYVCSCSVRNSVICLGLWGKVRHKCNK